jgi:hypothetical protein
MKFNPSPMQIVGIILIVNGVLTGSVNEMTDLFGAVWAKHVISLAVIGSGICGGFVTMFGRAPDQASQVRSVLAMPGVEKIDINGLANATLATMAIDPAQNKIAPTPAAMDKVAATAKAAAS